MHEQRAFFNQKAETWDAMRHTDWRKLTGLIERIGLQAGDNVLDVGCGTGVISGMLAQAVGSNGSVLGVDIAEKMIAVAAAKWADLPQVSLRAADVMTLAPRAVQAVVCLNVYPHFPQPDLFLQKMKAWLKPNGLLVIMHDKSRSEINAIHQGEATVAKDRLPPIEKVEELLAAQGYHVVDGGEGIGSYFLKATIVR